MRLPDIYIAAAVTSVLSLLLIGGLLCLRAPKAERGFLGILVLVMLPMNALAFHLIRMPLEGGLASIMGKQSEAFQLLQTLYAPMTEEPAKLWPLLIPFFYGRMKSIPVHRVALAIGLGFGVGEAWTVARFLSQMPEVAKYPWYMLGGYVIERTMVCVMHSAFTAAALALIFRRRQVILGVGVCMVLHFLANFPIFLARKDALGFSPQTWQMILQVWVQFYFLMMVGLLGFVAYGKKWFRKLIRGKIRCPECQKVYEHPFFGVNLFHKRYEKCAHCKHWHLVSAFHDEKVRDGELMETDSLAAATPLNAETAASSTQSTSTPCRRP